ncbi:hypothetical protein MMPV_008107 [Pyropia vietnamensis]
MAPDHRCPPHRRRGGLPPLAAAAVAALAAAAATGTSTFAELLQVQVIHRHGARTPLDKDASLSLTGYEGGATLLADGVAQLNTLGRLVRGVYLEDHSSLVVGEVVTGAALAGATGAYKVPSDFRAVSSSLDRTLTSSRAFIQGLFPQDQERVPTYVFHDDPDDYLLRAHALCPMHVNRVRAWYESDAFREKEAATAELRSTWAAKLGEPAGLSNWFNVYDQVFLHYYGHFSQNEKLPQPVPAADFKAIEDLAYWLEDNKYGADNMGHLVGGALLGELLDRARAMADSPGVSSAGDESASAAQDQDRPRRHRLIEYSAHYPTLLGLLTALGIPLSTVQPDGSLPHFGAALLLELHSAPDGRPALAARWYPGQDTASRPGLAYDARLRNITGSVLCGDGVTTGGLCPLAEVTARTEARRYGSAKAWCEACGNTVESPLCFAARAGVASAADSAERTGASGGGVDGSGKGGEGGGLARGAVAALAFVGGIVFAALVAGVAMWVRGARVRSAWAAHAVSDVAELGDVKEEDEMGGGGAGARGVGELVAPLR